MKGSAAIKAEYRKSIRAVAALLAVAFALQGAVGGVDFSLMRWPVNLFAGAILVLSIVCFALFPRSRFFRLLSGVPFAVTVIAALSLLGIVMGLVPQHTGVNRGLIYRTGIFQMTSGWPFALVYLATLLSLGCVIARRAVRLRIGDLSFYLNHVGLWIVLFSAGFGCADTIRCRMQVSVGETSRIAFDGNHAAELPFSVRLMAFDIEEYPPKLAVVDSATGDIDTRSGNSFFQIEGTSGSGKLAGRGLRIDRYFQHAVPDGDKGYIEARMPASSPAALIRVVDTANGNIFSGWICAGNSAQPHRLLPLEDGYAVAMLPPEPKKYVSDVEVAFPDGRIVRSGIEVNKPLRTSGWSLYQYSYDTSAGRMSSYSVIELVFDPWLTPVYAGIILMSAGAVCMVWSGRTKKKREYELG